MFERTFNYAKVGHEKTFNKENLKAVLIYNFKANKTWYLVEVECYRYDIYILKFYLKKHKKHPNKYQIMSNEYQCSKVIATCLKILLQHYFDNPKASFGFIGSNTFIPEKQIHEIKQNTKRFRVYRRLLISRIGEETFTHFHNEHNSTYLMINNNVEDVMVLKDKADKMFLEEFPDLLI